MTQKQRKGKRALVHTYTPPTTPNNHTLFPRCCTQVVSIQELSSRHCHGSAFLRHSCEAKRQNLVCSTVVLKKKLRCPPQPLKMTVFLRPFARSLAPLHPDMLAHVTILLLTVVHLQVKVVLRGDGSARACAVLPRVYEVFSQLCLVLHV